MIVDTIVIERPIKDSYGINFKRSFILILTDPAVAWKNDPCGKWSKTVAPACTIAAPARGDNT